MVAIYMMFCCAIGALLRFFLSRLNRQHVYLGTFLVNMLGCFCLGFVYRCVPDSPAYTILATGFCGGLTTYSTFQAELLALFKSPKNLVIYLAMTYVFGFLAICIGYFLPFALQK